MVEWDCLLQLDNFFLWGQGNNKEGMAVEGQLRNICHEAPQMEGIDEMVAHIMTRIMTNEMKVIVRQHQTSTDSRLPQAFTLVKRETQIY